MLNTKLDHPNYRAKVVKIEKLEPHSNADKLQIAVVDFQRVITGLDTKVGDLFVYFPLESQINKELVSFFNGFETMSLNQNVTIKGFFNKHARCRAIRLRGEVSEGYIHPVASINEFLKTQNCKFQITEKEVGVEFDSIGDITISQKYIVKTKQQTQGIGNPNKKLKRVSKIIDGQYRLHQDTAQLKRNIGRIEPDSIISITNKLHGCNAVFAKVLCKKKLKWYEKALKKLGVNIVDSHYDYVVGSRRTIKNEYADEVKQGYYDCDIWMHAFEGIKESIRDCITIYAEICGFLPSGGEIQKSYDYGCLPTKHKLFVFRVTYTNHAGEVFEFSWPQIKRYCERYNLVPAPSFYYGKAKDLYPELDTDTHWNENFLARLITEHLEKDCDMCNNKVPNEGIVLTVEDESWIGLKLKSEAFYLRESKELDSGVANIEDEG
jgi:tRNA-binding EMAP/Myf-like protein